MRFHVNRILRFTAEKKVFNVAEISPGCHFDNARRVFVSLLADKSTRNFRSKKEYWEILFFIRLPSLTKHLKNIIIRKY